MLVLRPPRATLVQEQIWVLSNKKQPKVPIAASEDLLATGHRDRSLTRGADETS